MVDVTDGADVDVRLVALELLLRHFLFAPVLKSLEGGGSWRTRESYRGSPRGVRSAWC
jgi:hypothetical protein